MTKRLALFGLTLAAYAGAAFSDNAVPSAAPTDALSAASSRIESLAHLSKDSLAHRPLNIQHWTTAEGARVLFVEAHELPMFDLRLTFAAGSSRDGDLPGLALLTNAMLNEGIPDQDVTAIAQGFESLGAHFSNGTYRDMALLSLRSLSMAQKRQPALALFTQILGHPTFPPESLARIRNQLLASFAQQQLNPAKLASHELFAKVYGSHPYGHPSDGNAESIVKIDVKQMQNFYADAYAAGNSVIALVGDLDRPTAEAMAAQVSQALPKGPALPALPEPNKPKAERYRIDFPSQQTHLLLAQLGIQRNDPDYAALFLGNQILGGGGFGTRLMEEVREKRGLTYGIYSGFTPMASKGPFMINVQTRAELAEGTLALVLQLVQNYLDQGPTEAELERSKRELAGSFPLSTASNGDIAGQLGSIGFYNLPLTFLEDFMAEVQTLTVQQVKEAMNRHLSATDFVIVSAGPTVPQQPLPPPSDKPLEEPMGVPEH